MDWLHERGMGEYAVERIPVAMLYNATPPIAIKPRGGSSGRGVSIARTVRQLRRAARTVDAARYLAERAIENRTEWGVHFTAFAGTLASVRCMEMEFADVLFVRRRRNNHGVRSVRWRTCPNELRRMTARVVRASAYSGFGCSGVKYGVGGPRIIEVNPRICGMAVNARRVMASMLNELASRVAACERGVSPQP